MVSPTRLKDCGEALSRLEESTGADWTQRLDARWAKFYFVPHQGGKVGTLGRQNERNSSWHLYIWFVFYVSLPMEIKQLLFNIFFFDSMPWLIIDQFACINQKKFVRNNSEKH